MGPALDKIVKIEEALNAAARPLVLVGGGCRAAWPIIRAFLEKHQIPFCTTWNAIDLFGGTLWAGLVGTYGGPGRSQAIQQCDTLLCLGTRVSGRITGANVAGFAPKAKKFLIDILPPLAHDVKFDAILKMDAGDFIDGLMVNRAAVPSEWLQACLSWRIPPDFAKWPWPYKMLSQIQAIIRDGIIVGDCGGNVVMCYHTMHFQPYRFITSNGNSPMGFSLAGAIGAAVAEPDRMVTCIIGDGGFQVNIQELATIKRIGLPNLRVLLINNAAYGITKQYQQTNMGKVLGAEAPDYVVPGFGDIAEAYRLDFRSIAEEWGHEENNANISAWLSEGCILEMWCPGFADYRPRLAHAMAPIDEVLTWL